MSDYDDSPHHADAAAWALLADALPAADVPSEARARFHALIAGAERFAPLAPEIAEVFDAPLDSVRSALSRIDEPAAWVALPVPGLQVMPVHARGQGAVVIAKLRAGTRIPRHTHRTRELTYVLDGVLITEGGERGRAACLDMAEGSEHALDVGPAEDCLVVFASPPPSRVS
jgi:anti-sigma factor ChrR (cupin superfamily)